MNINDLFNQIGKFWESISVPILFHILFFFCYWFIFGRPALKSRLLAYVASPSFERTKKILLEFGLWTKLPLIFCILILIYLSVFNNIAHLVALPNAFPLRVSYVEPDFLGEFRDKDALADIARYQPDSVVTLVMLNQFKQHLLQEYKVRYSDDYNQGVSWISDQFPKIYRYLELSVLTIFLITVLFFIRLFRKGTRRRGSLFLRYLLFFLIGSVVVLVFRYKIEQNIEERFCSEVYFVASALKADVNRKPFFSKGAVRIEGTHWDEGAERRPGPFLWVSDWVEESSLAEWFLGKARLSR